VKSQLMVWKNEGSVNLSDLRTFEKDTNDHPLERVSRMLHGAYCGTEGGKAFFLGCLLSLWPHKLLTLVREFLVVLPTLC